MLEHHIQKTIVNSLLSDESLRFAELRPEGIENKLFDYHLKILLRDKLIQKTESGGYSLTKEGKILGRRLMLDPLTFGKQAYSVSFLVIRRSGDGAWLLYKRLTQPLRGKTGFMHVVPRHDASITDSAEADVLAQTGLRCNFRRQGGGYFRIFHGSDLESFTHFELLRAEDVSDTLSVQADDAEFFWELEPVFLASDMLPNMGKLVEAYQSDEDFFLDLSIAKA